MSEKLTIEIIEDAQVIEGNELQLSVAASKEDVSIEWLVNRGRAWSLLSSTKALSLKVAKAFDGAKLKALVTDNQTGQTVASNVMSVSVIADIDKVTHAYPMAERTALERANLPT